MDALKKAEQDKKAAAKRLKEAQDNLPQDKLSQQDSQADDVAIQELSMEDHSIDLDQNDEELVPPVENQDELDITSQLEDLSLSPNTDQQPIAESKESDDPSRQDLSHAETSTTDSSSVEEKEQLAMADKPELELEIGEITVSEGTSVQDETVETSTGDAEDTVQAEQPIYSETISDAADEYFSSTVSVAQLAEDIGADSPTPVAAQTVFTATSRSTSNQIFQWGVFAILCLVIAVSLSFFVFNYTVPVERSIKSPLVARDIETQSEPVPAIEIPEDLVFAAEVDSRLFTGEITDVIEKENVTVVEGQETPADESVAINEPVQEVITEASVSAADEAEEKIWYPSDDISFEENATRDELVEELALSLPEKITPEPELIKISRSKSVDKSSVLVNKAYEGYLAGNFDSAEKNYLIVLNNLPENRDALLGLAAVSLHRGDVRQAYINYLEVLRLYPGDIVAEAALINFKDNRDHSRSESILKTFLQSEPDNSFLHYSLARLYAAQTRWPEAQQSFFDAHRIESSNADYAFNLAVSLEHVGQKKSAIDYYNVALDLADNSAVSFDSAVVISRINTLSNQADLQ